MTSGNVVRCRSEFIPISEGRDTVCRCSNQLIEETVAEMLTWLPGLLDDGGSVEP